MSKQRITIGGNRLGAGKRMQTEINDYERSNHNLSTKFTSSISAGLLYPSMCLIGNRGDTYEIDINAACRTIPTKGPLFGSFKLQVDVFQADFRLYQAILHNNPLAIGLNMPQVKLPKLKVATKVNKSDYHCGEYSKSCLQKYLGMSGIGVPWANTTATTMSREYLAIPTLAYYDIAKTYYSNKQEGKGYVVTPNQAVMGILGNTVFNSTLNEAENQDEIIVSSGANSRIYINSTDTTKSWFTKISKSLDSKHLDIKIIAKNTDNQEVTAIYPLYDLTDDYGVHWWIKNYEDYKIVKIEINRQLLKQYLLEEEVEVFNEPWEIHFYSVEQYGNQVPSVFQDYVKYGLKLSQFDLQNIDDMRYDILSYHTLGSSFVIDKSNNNGNKLPYFANLGQFTDNTTFNQCEQVGIVTKTYQNDIFNNWLKTEWLDGANGINEITKIAVSDGAFKIDSLILGEKIYNMLNRVALSGATWYDYLDVVYTKSARHHVENPIYCGGLEGEVMFEEIVQTSPAEGDPLGQLGGRGILQKGKGGKVIVKCDEPCIIMAIVSLTPRIMYTQGNEWYNTELDSIDDLHKPELDGIAFQNLMAEQMAWFGTTLDGDNIKARKTIGKLPAWINYQTNVDRAFADMAKEDGKGYMILNRNYEYDGTNQTIKDATTYVDPTKYNYAFASVGLDSMNFWIQVQFDVKARELMSANQIPHL